MVEIVYALPDRATIKAYRLRAPATVGDALALAAMDLIGKNIRTAYAEPGNHAARSFAVAPRSIPPSAASTTR